MSHLWDGGYSSKVFGGSGVLNCPGLSQTVLDEFGAIQT